MTEEKSEAASLELLGGALCLDFANTVGNHMTAQPSEHLAGYADWVAWSQHAGALTPTQARRLIAESGRYQLVDVSTVTDPATQAGNLHSCAGCEARIAAGLDADQSMIGIVTRISRTEYAVTYKVRDVRSGAIVGSGQTDLRMGANVAWSRGARWLIQNRLLER